MNGFFPINAYYFSFSYYQGNNELAVLLYTEAMKYSPVHETLWEGESMAIAAANRLDPLQRIKLLKKQNYFGKTLRLEK